MTSLYIHIPFCDQKCSYCDFMTLMLPPDKNKKSKMINQYTKSLITQIKKWSKALPKEEIKTIYLGGGTPLSLGKDNIDKILQAIQKYFDTSLLEELSIELNPIPHEKTINFIKTMNKKYEKVFRLRYSIGIQTFDDEILKSTDRDYYFNYLVGFLREISQLSQFNTLFNFDFIAFGKNQNNQFLFDDERKHNFLLDILESGFIDSFSVYGLELFEGSKRYHHNKSKENKFEVNQENIDQEFLKFKNLLLENNYNRYEISNFALAGKRSLHNWAYWNMSNYIGLGVSAASFLKKSKIQQIQSDGLRNKLQTKDKKNQAVRIQNASSIKKFNDGNYTKTITHLNKKDYNIEKFFLGLRTDKGVQNIKDFENILTPNYENKLKDFIENNYIQKENHILKLTDQGMDIYNHIITDLLR